MPQISFRPNKVGNFLKYEADRTEALARDTGVVTYTTAGAADMEVGQVLILDSNKYREILDGDVTAGTWANAQIAILLDDRIDEFRIADQALATPTNDTPADTALLVGGFSPCIVRRGGINFGTVASGNIAAVIAKLAGMAITVENVFSTKY